jgi:hypothetical protein
LPKGMRAYDVRVRDIGSCSAAQLIDLRLSTIPRWLEEAVVKECLENGEFLDGGNFPKRKEGGGWEFSGKVIISPWIYLSGKPEGLRPALIRLGQSGRATATAAATR